MDARDLERGQTPDAIPPVHDVDKPSSAAPVASNPSDSPIEAILPVIDGENSKAFEAWEQLPYVSPETLGLSTPSGGNILAMVVNEYYYRVLSNRSINKRTTRQAYLGETSVCGRRD